MAAFLSVPLLANSVAVNQREALQLKKPIELSVTDLNNFFSFVDESEFHTKADYQAFLKLQEKVSKMEEKRQAKRRVSMITAGAGLAASAILALLSLSNRNNWIPLTASLMSVAVATAAAVPAGLTPLNEPALLLRNIVNQYNSLQPRTMLAI